MDFVLVKANWGWGPDQLLRKDYPDLSTKKGLMISGVSDPPVLSEMEYYDVLYYETEWYKPKVSNHSKTIHAFGVDTRAMKPLEEEVFYDVISVGKFRRYKRYHKLLNKNGRVIAIGDMSSSGGNIIEKLRGGGVEVRGFVDYEELARLLNMSKLCYIPARLDGGGERAVLESRACGTPVEVEDDNPKLKELLDVPVWDHVYYSEQLEKGF
jgi:glycosyltransferase involved in cell wall biosynthesis